MRLALLAEETRRVMTCRMAILVTVALVWRGTGATRTSQMDAEVWNRVMCVSSLLLEFLSCFFYFKLIGFVDIDECEDESLNECTYKDKKYCMNVEGSYTCSCPEGYSGEGRGDHGCIKNHNMKIAYAFIGMHHALLSMIN